MNTLLIADDEPGIRRLVRMTLEHEQCQVLEAADGEEALSVARDEQPDLVLLDVMMPKRSGLEVCRILKDDPATSGIPVIMLTARAQESDLRESEEAGFVVKVHEVRSFGDLHESLVQRELGAIGDFVPRLRVDLDER